MKTSARFVHSLSDIILLLAAAVGQKTGEAIENEMKNPRVVLKPKQIFIKQTISGLLALVMGSSLFAADLVTSMEWQFGTSDNPSTVKPPPADNPFDGTGTATITPGAGTGYWSGTFLEGIDSGYGTKTGVWDIGNGGVQLSLDLYPATPSTQLAYTLTLDQFVSSGNFPFSHQVTFSISDTPVVNSTLLENTVNGQWVETVYQWTGLSVSGPVDLDIFSDPGKALLLDRVAFSVAGDLGSAAVPEPLASAGVFGLWRWASPCGVGVVPVEPLLEFPNPPPSVGSGTVVLVGRRYDGAAIPAGTQPGPT